VNPGLLQNGTNYISLRAVDLAGNTSAWIDAFTILRDVLPPAYVNLQSGDFTWRNASGTVYAVQFNDAGGSLLSGLKILVSTSAAGAGVPVIDWSDCLTCIQAKDFTSPWPLTAAQFNALLPGTTNYVSLRLQDVAGNTSTYMDAFFILKDTTAPRCVNNETADRGWFPSDPGAVWDIDFFDDPVPGRIPGCSSLDTVSYRARTSTGGIVIDWTPLATSVHRSSYTANFAVDFAKLFTGVNRIDVRATDLAGNTTVYSDAFTVKKDTTVPQISVAFDAATVAWVNASCVYNMNFHSGGPTTLQALQYAVATGPNRTGTALVPWTDIVAYRSIRPRMPRHGSRPSRPCRTAGRTTSPCVPGTSPARPLRSSTRSASARIFLRR
jgi:hypothetical protein